MDNIVSELLKVDKTLTSEQKKRLNSYKEKLDAHEGFHFEHKSMSGEDSEVGAEVTINYVRRFIDKIVRFTLGEKCFSIDAYNQDDQEDILPYMNDNWENNRKKTLSTSMLKWGSLLGDVYVVVEPSKRMLVDILAKNTKTKKKSEQMKETLTIEEWLEPDFLIKVIPATNGFPYYREDKTEPFSPMVMFEYKEVRTKPKEELKKAYKGRTYNDRKFLEYADYLEKRSKDHTKNEEGDGDNDKYIYKKVYYTDKIEEWYGDKLVETYNLNYGIVPVVHIPNKIKSSNTPYGDDDVSDIIPLNYELNYKASDVSEIINYYQSPLTLFFGVGLDTIEKGSDRMLSGLPKDSKVQNLEMQSDLSATNSYMSFIKDSMLEIFGINANGLQGTSNISNTTGVALHMQYEPLMERKQEKATYLDGIAKVNTYLIYLGVFYGRIKSLAGQNVKDLLATKPHIFQTNVTFPNTLPKDELMIIQKGNSKIQAGVGTREDLLRDMGETDPIKKLQEVEQDQLAILRLELIKGLVANIAKDGVSPDAFANMKAMFPSKEGGNGEKDFATGFLNDPFLTALITMNHKSVEEDKNDIEKMKAKQQKEETKEIRVLKGKTQTIV